MAQVAGTEGILSKSCGQL
uniref:Uncharacterized protein n=1 Tax=Arundo donax TaxID=35708 RepID=A0A0A8ZPW4_ARUDO